MRVCYTQVSVHIYVQDIYNYAQFKKFIVYRCEFCMNSKLVTAGTITDIIKTLHFY